MKDFLRTVIVLLRDIVIAFLEVNLTILTDLKSFRNKLVLFICILVLLVIYRDSDYRVSLAALGLLEIFLCYYFNNRKIKDQSIVHKIVDKM